MTTIVKADSDMLTVLGLETTQLMVRQSIGIRKGLDLSRKVDRDIYAVETARLTALDSILKASRTAKKRKGLKIVGVDR